VSSNSDVGAKFHADGVGEIALPPAAIRELFEAVETGGENVEKIEIVFVKTLDRVAKKVSNTYQEATLGKSKYKPENVFDVSLMVNDTPFKKDFSTELTVALPYEKPDEENEKYILVNHIRDDGEEEPMREGKRYDEKNRQISFKVRHFSIYAITYEEPATEEGDGKQSESGGGCDAGLSMAWGAVAVLFAAIAVARGKRAS
jgi:hypothetical protein